MTVLDLIGNVFKELDKVLEEDGEELGTALENASEEIFKAVEDSASKIAARIDEIVGTEESDEETEEFVAFEWITKREMIERIVPFKKDCYIKAFKELFGEDYEN